MPRVSKFTPPHASEGGRTRKRPERRTSANINTVPSPEDLYARPRAKPSTKLVLPLNDAQERYDAAIRSERVIFGVGPAGTGKTWFAAMRAAEALLTGVTEKIVITRPAVEAGESLGFLPGELEEKYEPYIRPLRDAFEEKFGVGHFEYLLKHGIIEARPLGLLRGSTLKNCWVLADEMQNATIKQMKMFLTRIGTNSKFIINGDPRQSDLPEHQSGLQDAYRRTVSVRGITMVSFTNADIVRDGICQEIVECYERD